jgi:hypothetical protein
MFYLIDHIGTFYACCSYEQENVIKDKGFFTNDYRDEEINF